MKKLKINPSKLAIRRAEIPAEAEIKAVKLTYAQAMAFDSSQVMTFDELLANYGYNQLRAGEVYNGYIAVLYSWGRADVVYMQGYLEKISPKEADFCFDLNRAKMIREGRGWTVCWQTSDGEICQGEFSYVWTFNGCRFAEEITRLQKGGYLSPEFNPDTMADMLKGKLISALQTDEKIIDLTDNEDFILRVYLGAHSYYKEFFTEVK